MHRSVRLTSLLTLALAFSVACNKPANSSASNDAIATDIKAKMFSEPLLKSSTINISVKDGIVTLSGQLSDDAARLAAERIASSTKGVSKVVDQTNVPIKPAMAEYVPPTAPAPAHARKSSHPARAPEPQAAATPPTPPSPANPPATESSSVEAPTGPAPIPAAAPAPAPAPVPVAPPPPLPVTVTLPVGTVFTVRTIDSIDSSTSQPGHIFRASLDAPVSLENNLVVPKGLHVNLKLIAANTASGLNGSSELTVALDSFTYQGKTYRISSSDVQQKGESRGKRSAAVIGGGAVLGAIIGGLAGGGRGAAIGAGAGGAGGAAVQVATHGKRVRIPPETHLDFTLRDSVDVTYVPTKKSTQSSSTTPPPATTEPSTSTTTIPPQQPQ